MKISRKSVLDQNLYFSSCLHGIMSFFGNALSDMVYMKFVVSSLLTVVFNQIWNEVLYLR